MTRLSRWAKTHLGCAGSPRRPRVAAAAGGRGGGGGGPAGPVSPSPPTKERLPWPTHGPCRPRGRSGVFQATWGALSSDRLFSSHSGRRSPSGAVNSLPRVFASQGSHPWRRLFAPVSPLGYPRGSLARGVVRHCPSVLRVLPWLPRPPPPAAPCSLSLPRSGL